MIPYAVLFIGIVSVCPSDASTSRMMFRPWSSLDANLEEFVAEGVTYGKCSFFKDNEMVELTYEEFDGALHVRSTRPYVEDPVVKIQECRDAARKKSQNKLKSRRDLRGIAQQEEADEEVIHRLEKFQEEAGVAPAPNHESRFYGPIQQLKIYRKRVNMFPNFGIPRYTFPRVQIQFKQNDGLTVFLITP